MKTEQDIKHANAESMAEFNKTVDNIYTILQVIVEKGWVKKLREKLLGLFIDWWDEQLEFTKLFQKEWKSTFK